MHSSTRATQKRGGGGEGRPDHEGHRSCSCSLAWAWAPLMMSTFCRYLSPLALWSRKSTVVEELVPCRRLTQFPSGTLLPARLLTSLLTPLTLALLPSSFHLTSLCMWAAIVVLFSVLRAPLPCPVYVLINNYLCTKNSNVKNISLTRSLHSPPRGHAGASLATIRH